MLDRIARARAKPRAHAWELIAATATGFPWLVIAGKALDGWVVTDMDATLVTARVGEGRSPAHVEERLRFPPAGGLLGGVDLVTAPGSQSGLTAALSRYGMPGVPAASVTISCSGIDRPRSQAAW